jgi:AbrB family looped-hinge helix DNA binding protein
MTITTVSPKFQVVIPKEIRVLFEVKSGMKYMVTPEANGSFRFTPAKVKTIKELRGFLKGKITPFKREPDREV